MLLPLLTLYYVLEVKSQKMKPNTWFVAGLVFSFFGDLFLLFKWGFLLGLGSFLLAHVFYVICFIKLKIKNAWGFLPFIIAYLLGLFCYLFPHLDEMKIPVILYGIVISAMLFTSLRTGKSLLIVSALLFVISDSILSISLFVNSNVVLQLLVMLTYVAAQFLLVLGMLKSTK
ncbi:lysoplasmalogenase [Chryseobacterium sp. POL2]|nr:lysoplasmalogenase [Chryseobacterium sp. POL2]